MTTWYLLFLIIYLHSTLFKLLPSIGTAVSADNLIYILLYLNYYGATVMNNVITSIFTFYFI